MSLFKRKQEQLVFTEINELTVCFQPPATLKSQIAMMGLNELDLKRLLSLKSIIEKNAEGLVDSFYASIMKETSLLTIINQHSHVDKLRKTLHRHVVQIFSGKIDAEYIEQRKRIAHVHVRIGLGTKWYLNAFQQLLTSIVHVFYTEIQNKTELYDAVSSLQKIFSLEQQLVLESYEIRNEDIREEQEIIKEEIRRKVTSSANDLSSIAEETSGALSEIVEQIKQIEELTDDSNLSIQKVHTLSETGKVRMNDEKRSIDKMRGDISSLHTEVNQLLDINNKVDSVVEVVSSIAKQINLLALNASIEAARAGEHGKGFAVVASEVRNLSELTKQSTEDIAELIKTISVQIKDVNHSVTLFEKDVRNSEKVTEDTIVFFNEIVESVQQSKEKSEVIFSSIKKSNKTLQHIQQSTEDLYHTAESLSNA